MSTKIKVLSVCGSGVVTSHMVANKIVDMFADEGYDVDAEECTPSERASASRASPSSLAPTAPSCPRSLTT